MECLKQVKPRILPDYAGEPVSPFRSAVKQASRLFRGRAMLFAAVTLAMALLLPVTLTTANPAPASTPTGEDVLELVRARESDQHRDLTGRLWTSTDAGKLVAPFKLLMRGPTITYQFANPPEALVLHLGEKKSRLERVTGSGKAQSITGAKLDGPVRGTDITYEDLALKFLYWHNAKLTGEDTLMTRDCWVVQAVPSAKDESQYDLIRLWVDKSGGLLKAECYVGGRLAKRFQVRNVQHSKTGGYFLKTLRVETPGKKTPTYLEIDPA